VEIGNSAAQGSNKSSHPWPIMVMDITSSANSASTLGKSLDNFTPMKI
jgi:hypothetical protein